jgi:hypothetical protein
LATGRFAESLIQRKGKEINVKGILPGRILVHEMENLYASTPISFMRHTSS